VFLGATTIGEKDGMVHETIKILSDYEQLHVLNEVNVGHNKLLKTCYDTVTKLLTMQICNVSFLK